MILKNKKEKFTPIIQKEENLIVLFSHPFFDEDLAGQTENLLKAGLDWDSLLKRSRKEGVSCLLYAHLNKFFLSNHLPENTLKDLKTIYYVNLSRNMILLEQTKKILKIFREKHMEAILLKGIFLSENIYHNIALRPSTDVDILIRQEDIVKANAILNELGYASPPNYQDDLLKDELKPLASLVYYVRDSEVSNGANKQFCDRFFIHLHWHLINSTWPVDATFSKIDMARIWAMAEATGIDGVPVLSLSAQHLLIYLACHCFNHCVDRLILLSDIAAVFASYRDKIDWDELVRETERFHLSYVVYHSLLLTSKILGLQIPQIEKLKPGKMSFFQKFFSFAIINGKRGYLLYFWTYFFLQKGFRGKGRFIFRTFFPSPCVMAHSFNLSPSQITFLHYGKRFFNNFFKCFSFHL